MPRMNDPRLLLSNEEDDYRMVVSPLSKARFHAKEDKGAARILAGPLERRGDGFVPLALLSRRDIRQ
jgi:hypothetical protein